MIVPATTALDAALLALLHVGPSFWVVGGRVSRETLSGGGDDGLLRRIRSYGNVAE